MALKMFYIEDSHTFFRGGYRPRKEYELKLATSLEPDDLHNKKLDFSAVALRLGSSNWDKESDGILSINLNLTKPVVIKASGPISAQNVDTLHYTFAFKQARRDRAVSSVDNTPIFSNVSARKYLTQSGNIKFSLEFSLAKSGGSNTNILIDMASQILKDPSVKAGLITTLPVLGIASAVFEAIRKTFFDSGDARTIWNQKTVHFKGGAGPGIPLKVGRYVLAPMKESDDEVEYSYRYRGSKLVDRRKKHKDDKIKDLEQFYLDIYAY